MVDISACGDVLDPLRKVCDVVELPADALQLRRQVNDFDVYLASLHVRLEAEYISDGTRLKAVATPSTGLDHLDVAACQERGIEVLSLRNEREFLDRVTATAELAWALLLCVVRRLPWAVQSAHAGIWARDQFRGSQLSGKTLGIVGYGRLGRMVGEFGKSFRMRVLATDLNTNPAVSGIEFMSLEQLLPQADVISIHVHLTEATRGMIGAEQFALMKPNAVLINTSRGAIVDESALLAALERGALGGAGLDVVDGEWRADLVNHPLIRYASAHKNLVISPHIGGVTHESQRMGFSHMVGMILNYLHARRLI
jgi:D-3-phosphoglycerate dehydrogenase